MITTREHARRSARHFGGAPEDYLAIHAFLDGPLEGEGGARRRALTHNAWFLQAVPERIFGRVIVNGDGYEVSVSSICARHVEDALGCVPSAQDWIQAMEYQAWMTNGRTARPPSQVAATGGDEDEPE